MTRTWFITGANRGLGRAFTVAALAEGDRVVATARDPRSMGELADERLTVLPLDVRDRAGVIATVDKAFALMGTIDVIVNNAGYGLVGAIEELTEAQIRDQMDTNFYGALWVSQAAVPHLRAQGSGHIVQISTVGAVGSLPLFGMYNASKWALEGFSASLADELRPFGISVTMAQMGGFDTDWAKSSMQFGSGLPAYEELRTSILGMPNYPDPSTPPSTGADTNTDLYADTNPNANADADADAQSDTNANPDASTEFDADVNAGHDANADSDANAQSDTNTDADADAEWQEAAPEVGAVGLIALVNMPNPPIRKVIGPGAHQMVAIALDQRRQDYMTDPEFTWPS